MYHSDDVSCRAIMKLLVFCLCFCCVSAWTTDDLELFDLVEDVNQNFYELLDISQDAAVSDVKKAYRKLSRTLHPDRNKEADAEVKFRQLSSVYEVLKDKEKRESYDSVLQNGLPDWRQPVYYYRRVRKMGLLESIVLISLIFTVGHYIYRWTAYIEKKFVREEWYREMEKKVERKTKKKQMDQKLDELQDMLQEELKLIGKPKLSDLIPIQLGRLLLSAVKCTPGICKEIVETVREKLKSPPVEESDADEQEVRAPRKSTRPSVPAEKFVPEMAASSDPVVVYNDGQAGDVGDGEPQHMTQEGSPWTDSDVSLLIKAIAKYPSGTAKRWEKVSRMVGRSVNEVTRKSKHIKTGISAKPTNTSLQSKTGGQIIDNVELSQRDEYELRPDDSSNNTQNAAANNTKDPADSWTQRDQKLLEQALARYPKGASERWEKVSEYIPGKSKEECMVRFKYLADLVRKRRVADNNTAAS